MQRILHQPDRDKEWKWSWILKARRINLYCCFNTITFKFMMHLNFERTISLRQTENLFTYKSILLNSMLCVLHICVCNTVVRVCIICVQGIALKWLISMWLAERICYCMVAHMETVHTKLCRLYTFCLLPNAMANLEFDFKKSVILCGLQ